MEIRESGLIFDDGVKRQKPIVYEVTDTGCWQCTSHKGSDGRYTQVSYKGYTERLHRLSYRLHHGRIAKGRVIMHKCDNVKCFNPDHLEMGTQKMNMRDMKRKDRHNNFNWRNRNGSSSGNEEG